MKKLSIVIVSLFSILFVSAQNNGDQNNRRYDRRDNDRQNNRGYDNNNTNYNNRSIVTVTFNGNSNQQVLIDGQNYNGRNNGSNSIQITNLQPGQHSLQINNGSGGRGILASIFGGGNSNNSAATTFNLRSGYDMNIVVNANGRARIRETRSANYQNNNNQRNNRYGRNDGNTNYNR